VTALEEILDIAAEDGPGKNGVIHGYVMVKLATLKDVLENGAVPQ